jgi:hypothetical protein
MSMIGTRIKTSAGANEHPDGQRTQSHMAALFGCLMFVTLAWHAPLALCSSPMDSLRAPVGAGREFVDPCLGSHWKIQTNAEHPGWPGRLVLMDVGAVRGGQGGNSASAVSVENKAGRASSSSREVPQFSANLALPLAVRAGDRLIVEQDSAVLHAEFQAVALESAMAGDSVRVRLSAASTAPQSIAGKVVSVLVTGAGQARWTFEKEINP